MTLFYNDLSGYDVGFKVPAGTPAVVAKATEGIYYMDKQYHNFEQQAAALGVPFSGYHFLKSESSPEAQAAWYHGFAGNTPCMLDVETEGGSRPGVDFVLRFMKALQGLGGRVWGVYYPKWYWQLTGGDLGAVQRAGAVIVSSSYGPYSDTGDGWLPYGGATPRIWQYQGSPRDTNAFKGTAEELASLINGDNMNAVDVWAWRNLTLDPIDMRQRLVNAETNAEQANAKADKILAAVTDLAAKVASGGVDPNAIAADVLADLKAKL